MKRLTLLFVLGTLVCSAQEVRITRPAVLKSERTIVSLKTGTMVNLLARDEYTLTVRFNNHTGTIPASSLVPVSPAKQTEVQSSFPAKKSGSRYVNAVNKTKENAANHGQNSAKQVDTVLAAN